MFLYDLIDWLKRALADADGAPSASRLTMLLWSLVLLAVFAFCAINESLHTGKLPDVTTWTSFLGLSQAGGVLGYGINQLRRAVTEKSADPPRAT